VLVVAPLGAEQHVPVLMGGLKLGTGAMRIEVLIALGAIDLVHVLLQAGRAELIILMVWMTEEVAPKASDAECLTATLALGLGVKLVLQARGAVVAVLVVEPGLGVIDLVLLADYAVALLLADKTTQTDLGLCRFSRGRHLDRVIMDSYGELCHCAADRDTRVLGERQLQLYWRSFFTGRILVFF